MNIKEQTLSRNLKRETIVKCFKKCDIISGVSAVVARIGANEDPFDDLNEAHELTALVDELGFYILSTRICHRNVLIFHAPEHLKLETPLQQPPLYNSQNAIPQQCLL